MIDKKIDSWIYTYICICTYVYTYINVYVHIYTYWYICVIYKMYAAVTASAHYVCVCGYMCGFVCVCVCKYVCVCFVCVCSVRVCVYGCVGVCMCVLVCSSVVRNVVVLLGVCCKCVYVCAYMCVCTCVCVRACACTSCNQGSAWEKVADSRHYSVCTGVDARCIWSEDLVHQHSARGSYFSATHVVDFIFRQHAHERRTMRRRILLRKKFSHFRRRSITAHFPEGHLWSSSLNYVVQFGTIKQHCVDNGGANSFGNMISRNRQPQGPTSCFAHGIVGGYFFYMLDRHFDWLSILILRNWCSRQARFFTFDITLSTQNRVAHTVWKISPYRGRLNYVHFGRGFLVTAGIWIGSVFWFCGIGVHFKLNLLISALRWAQNRVAHTVWKISPYRGRLNYFHFWRGFLLATGIWIGSVFWFCGIGVHVKLALLISALRWAQNRVAYIVWENSLFEVSFRVWIQDLH